MTQKSFSVVNRSRAEVIGGYYANAAGAIETGLLVKASTAKALTLANYTDKPDGFAEGLRQLVYAPTVLTLDAGEYCNIIDGHVLIRCDANFFYGATLPNENDIVYVGNSGLMTTTGGVYKLGKCIKDGEEYRVPPNSSAETVLLDLTLGGLETV